MNYKPIVVVAGEPFSIFSEIFFKSLKKYHCKQPIILITSKNHFIAHMNYFKYNFKINLIDNNKFSIKKRYFFLKL